jgi:AraC family transcriptional regulator of adaptative response / DNA-3-methyladenine glycosylase II
MDRTYRIWRRLGVTDRNLRRVFGAEFGVSPVQFAQTHRLLLGRRLLAETTLPIIEIAIASGFVSLGRFKALFKKRYRLSPSEFRRKGGRVSRAEVFTLQPGYRLLWIGRT